MNTTPITDSGEQSSIMKDSAPTEAARPYDGAGPFMAFQTPIEKIREVVVANLGESTMRIMDLERIRIPAGGGTVWTVPDISGEQNVKELSGVIVGRHEVRTYWKLRMELSDGASPPDCYSPDAKKGFGDPGGACACCPHGHFGQACKLYLLLYFLRPDNLLPDIVSLPATSIKPARLHLRRLAVRGLASYDLITNIGLEKTKNDQGIEYSKATFTAGSLLPPEQARHAAEYALMLKAFIDTAPPSIAKAPQRTEGEVI
jgi:hypothetical protein